MPVDILVCDRNDFNNRKDNQTTFEYIIATEGIKLYDKIDDTRRWFEHARMTLRRNCFVGTIDPS